MVAIKQTPVTMGYNSKKSSSQFGHKRLKGPDLDKTGNI